MWWSVYIIKKTTMFSSVVERWTVVPLVMCSTHIT